MATLLDLFCGAGGAAMGYHRAGFDQIVGVDIKPQPRYPFTFVLGDALEYVKAHGHEFDAIHASPPCQRYTYLQAMWNSRPHPDLVAPTREILDIIGAPWVMENVPQSPLRRGALMLCGSMFSLTTADARAELRRHRYFEASFRWATLLPQCAHGRAVAVIGVYGSSDRRDNRRPRTVGVYGNAVGSSQRDGLYQFSTTERSQAMGIDWMTGDELSQAIPPAYCEFIGAQLLQALHA